MVSRVKVEVKGYVCFVEKDKIGTLDNNKMSALVANWVAGVVAVHGDSGVRDPRFHIRYALLSFVLTSIFS